MDFTEFVRSRSAGLVRLAYLLTGDAHRAEDLVQEALLRAHRRWRRVQAADNADAYVRTILLHQYASWRRRRSSSELPVEQVGDRAARADLSGEHAERDRMWRVLATLPERQRAVLVLRHYEHLDDASIARLLGCAEPTVRSLAFRAAAALRTHPDLSRQEQP